MPADVIAKWLKAGRSARIAGKCVRPRRHTLLRDKPLSIRRGQAEVFALTADDGTAWLLKKFHQGMTLDRAYLQAVGTVLPRRAGFGSGLDRHVLQSANLQTEQGCFHTEELRQWLDGTLLIPRAPGLDWATVADDLRSGLTTLDRKYRLMVCLDLINLVRRLEQHKCAHRDLSSGNVFVDLGSFSASLIDFDSLYHPSLSMPPTTTCGSEGYTAPYAWRNGRLDPRATWCRRADRFAMALLSVEVLILDRGDTLTGDGGLFSQDELNSRRGPGLTRIRQSLQSRCPSAVPLLDAAIAAADADRCPAPDVWTQALGDATPAHAPPLRSMAAAPADIFARVLSKRAVVRPVPPAPRLAGMRAACLKVPMNGAVSLHQMPDPWHSRRESLEPSGV